MKKCILSILAVLLMSSVVLAKSDHRKKKDEKDCYNKRQCKVQKKCTKNNRYKQYESKGCSPRPKKRCKSSSAKTCTDESYYSWLYRYYHYDGKKTRPKPKPNLLDLAVQLNTEGKFAGTFDTLIAAVLAADPLVADALAGKDKLTVFAPTDEAFEALALMPENIGDLDQAFLTNVLLYHVTAGRLCAAKVLALEMIEMLNGEFLLQDGGVLTDNLGRPATIIVTNVKAKNGVIHVIDAVVLPEAP